MSAHHALEPAHRPAHAPGHGLGRRRLLAASTALMFATLRAPAHGLVVYDPANHAENLVQTVRALYAEVQRNINNQAVSYTAQAHYLNLVPLDAASHAAMAPNLSAINGAIGSLRQVQSSAASMEALYAQLRGMAGSLEAGGNVSAYLNVVDTIRRSLNQDVATVSSAFISMTAANAQLDTILARSTSSLGAAQSQQIGHHLQAMQVREAGQQRYLKALELQRDAIDRELQDARAHAAQVLARRQAEELINFGRQGQ